MHKERSIVRKKKETLLLSVNVQPLFPDFSVIGIPCGKSNFFACKQQGLAMKRQVAAWLQPTVEIQLIDRISPPAGLRSWGHLN